MAETPSFLLPFVLSPPACEPDRVGAVDFSVPAGDGPFPAVLIVHGGPMPAQVVPKPRDWPVYRGYAAELAAHGILAGVVEHRLHVVPGPEGVIFDYATAAADVAAAVETLRADKRADPDRALLWFFSGGSLLSGDWLRDAPAWLRGVALSYPVLTPLPGGHTDPRFGPVADVLGGGGGFPPILLTRVGLENPAFAEGVDEFLAVAARSGVPVEVVDVPHGRHSFDVLDHTDESRAAVRRAIGWVCARLGQPV